MSTIDHSRIARNTLMLYIRMALIMLVSLYTSRVVLDSLGSVDFGLYSAVGGIVLMFSFLSGTLGTACQRFLSQDIGAQDFEQARRTFNLCVLVFGALAVLVFVLAESAGLWFLLSKMQTLGRDTAAMWVFQTSILSFLLTLLRLPYQGMVIIREKMKVFAYVSVVEALGALGVAILLSRSNSDRLILYSLLMLGLNACISLFYVAYCTHFWKECKWCRCWDTSKARSIFSFAGWNLVGSLASISKSHGINILLNIFFGPVVNAARSLAWKVGSTLQQFMDSFYTAVRPQILKSWGAGEKKGMMQLVCQSSKFSFLLLFALGLPVIMEAPTLLSLWLKEVPDSTVLFTRLIVINTLVECLANPLSTAIQAQGDIKLYQIVCGSAMLLILPASYLALKLGAPAQSVFYIAIALNFVAIILRLVIVHAKVGLSIKDYLGSVALPLILTVLSCTLSSLILRDVPFSSIAVVLVLIPLLGLKRSERAYCLNLVFKKNLQ